MRRQRRARARRDFGWLECERVRPCETGPLPVRAVAEASFSSQLRKLHLKTLCGLAQHGVKEARIDLFGYATCITRGCDHRESPHLDALRLAALAR